MHHSNRYEFQRPMCSLRPSVPIIRSSILKIYVSRSVGFNCLSLLAAAVMKRGAIVPAAGTIAALGALSAYTFVLIGRSCADTGAESYEQSWARTVGQKSAWLPAGLCVATCFAGCLAYTLIIGDSFSALAETFGAPTAMSRRSNVILGISTLVLLPLSLLKSERAASLRGISSVGGAAYSGVYKCVEGRSIYAHVSYRLSPKKIVCMCVNLYLFLGGSTRVYEIV